MTVAEFLEWEPGDVPARRWQLVDGAPVAMAPASPRHGALIGELARLIGNHLAAERPQCRGAVKPGIRPLVQSGMNWRIPDIGVTCGPLGDGPNLPDPVLLIEVLSPSNEAATRANVWSYLTLPSVAEMALISSTEPRAELLRRDLRGMWPAQAALLRKDGVLELRSIGMHIPLAALFAPLGLA